MFHKKCPYFQWKTSLFLALKNIKTDTIKCIFWTITKIKENFLHSQNFQKISHILKESKSNTLVDFYLHHKFMLHQRCKISRQILVICGKFCFSSFIWRKLRLRLIECSEVLTVELLLVKERVVSGFNASKTVSLMSKTGMTVEKRKFRIGGITCWRLVPNARRIGGIMVNNSTSHLETPQSHVNDLEARQLGSVQVEAERCWTAFFCVWTTVLKTESEGILTSNCDLRRKIGPLRLFQAQKIMGNTRTCLHVDG